MQDTKPSTLPSTLIIAMPGLLQLLNATREFGSIILYFLFLMGVRSHGHQSEYCSSSLNYLGTEHVAMSSATLAKSILQRQVYELLPG